MFTRKVVFEETHICKSRNVCKSTVGVDASQLYPYSMFQPMLTRLYTRYEFDADLQRFNPRQTKSKKFENMVMSCFQRMRPDCGIESFYTTVTERKIDCFTAEGSSAHCNTVFEAISCFNPYCPVKKHDLP